MMRKYFAGLIFIIFVGCNSNVSKEEYDILSDKNNELQRENSQLIIDNKNLLQRSNAIQNEHTNLNKKYLNIRNVKEIIEYEKQLEDIETRVKTNESYVVIEDSRDNLLFDYFDDGIFIFGLTVIEGYYRKHAIAWEDDRDIEFDSFVITDGERAYLNSITKRQFSGNTIYDMNENGYPIVNIKMHLLNKEIQDKVKNSNEERRIKLKIFIIQPGGDHSHSLYPIEILDVIQ
jgi:hypothetical protein